MATMRMRIPTAWHLAGSSRARASEAIAVTTPTCKSALFGAYVHGDAPPRRLRSCRRSTP